MSAKSLIPSLIMRLRAPFPCFCLSALSLSSSLVDSLSSCFIFSKAFSLLVLGGDPKPWVIPSGVTFGVTFDGQLPVEFPELGAGLEPPLSLPGVDPTIPFVARPRCHWGKDGDQKPSTKKSLAKMISLLVLCKKSNSSF